MKRILQTSVVAAAIAAGVSLTAQSVPTLNFDGATDVISLPSYGEVAGVATNSKGNIYVYARTGHAVATLGDERTFYHGGSRIFQFDGSGKFVKEIGQGVYAVNFAQNIRVDPQDNVWIVDAGSNMLVKFDPNGKALMVLGRKPENIPVRPGPGIPASVPDVKSAEAAGRGAEAGRGGGGEGGRGGGRGTPGAGINGDSFNRPSDVTWDKAGNVYVADGYGSNNRIAKFTKDGNFVKTFGSTGSGNGQFNGIRGLVSDAAGNLYVADAGNKRIVVLDGEGTFKSAITGIGTPMAICITGGANQFIYSSNSNEAESTENGEIYKIRTTGQVVGRFGSAGKLAKQFGMANSLDCRTENNLWVGEVQNWRAQKITLK